MSPSTSKLQISVFKVFPCALMRLLSSCWFDGSPRGVGQKERVTGRGSAIVLGAGS